MTGCVYNGMFLTTYEEITQIMFLIMPFIGSMKQYRIFYANYLKGRRVFHGLKFNYLSNCLVFNLFLQ